MISSQSNNINRYDSSSDPFILQCCLPQNKEPYIGVDEKCKKNAVFCLEHNCHKNDEGLLHQMMPLRQFKRNIDQKKFNMHSKVNILVQSLSKFIDKLIEQIQEIKLRKCLELSMLWLRDLAESQVEYELMKKVYRTDFRNVSCKDVHSIYYKIIRNQDLYSKKVENMSCYQGICKVLQEIGQNKKAIHLLAEKLTQIQGVLTNGELLKKVMPQTKIRDDSLKQIILEEPKSNSPNFQISYNKFELLTSWPQHKPVFSKYEVISHVTYHIKIKTKYANIMIGICAKTLKQAQSSSSSSLYYNQNCILYNCANGSTYHDGMFTSGSNLPIRGLKELKLQLRLTKDQLLLMTNTGILVRTSIKPILQKSEGGNKIYLMFLARTQGDSFEVYCDNDINAENVQALKTMNTIQQQKQRYLTLTQERSSPIILSDPNTLGREKQIGSISDEKLSQSPIIMGSVQDTEEINPYKVVPKLQLQNSHNSHIQQVNQYSRATNRQANSHLINQITQQDSQMETTMKLNESPNISMGLTRNRLDDSIKNASGTLNHKMKDVDQNASLDLAKIRSNLDNLKHNFITESNQGLNRIQQKKQIRQPEDKSWSKQKDQYLKDIRDKVSQLRSPNTNIKTNLNTINENKKQDKLEPVKYNTQIKKVDKQKQKLSIDLQPNTGVRLKSQSSQNYNKLKSLKSGSGASNKQSQNSKVKINLSEEGFSQFNSIVRVSLMSGLRKGSQNMNDDQVKLMAFAQMAESMQPQSSTSYMNQMGKIKTPPKINYMDQRFEMNQSFQM